MTGPWSSPRNVYLGENRTHVSPYAAPARATNVTGLPRTYIDVGNLDLFSREIITFAGRLAAANVEVELHVHPGLPHSWDNMAFDITATKIADRNRAASPSSFKKREATGSIEIACMSLASR